MITKLRKYSADGAAATLFEPTEEYLDSSKIVPLRPNEVNKRNSKQHNKQSNSTDTSPKGWALMDLETGEEINRISPEDRITITRKETIDAYKKHLERHPIDNGSYAKVFQNIDSSLIQQLTGADFKVFHIMIRYVNYDGEITFNNGKPVRIWHLVVETGLSQRAVEMALQRLKYNEIIYREPRNKTAPFLMNPFIVHKGEKCPPGLYKLFHKTSHNKNYKPAQ